MGGEEEITFLVVQWQEQLLSACADGFGQSRTLGMVKEQLQLRQNMVGFAVMDHPEEREVYVGSYEKKSLFRG